MGLYRGPHIITEDLFIQLDFSSPRCLNNGLTSVKNLADGGETCTITNSGTDISLDTTTIGGGLNCLNWAGSTAAYIDTPDTGGMPLFSLEVWVYNVSGGNSRHSVFRNFWEIVGTQICFWSYSFANDYWRCSPSSLVPYNAWTQIVTTWDGSVIRHYINGELEWTDSSTSSGTSESMYHLAGYDGRRFKGKIASFSCYKKTLNASEVLQNFNAKKDRFGK